MRRDLPGHTVESVPLIGWAGLKNGDLLHRAEQHFNVLITMDVSLPQQQNLAKFKLAVVGLKARSNRLAETRPLMPKVLALLPKLQAGKVIVVSR